MKLYIKHRVESCKGEFVIPEIKHSEATLDDIKAYLAEQGLVAVPVEHLTKVLAISDRKHDSWDALKAMIKVAGDWK